MDYPESERCTTDGKISTGAIAINFKRKKRDLQDARQVICAGGPITTGEFNFCIDSKHIAGAGGRRMRIYNIQSGISSHEIQIRNYLRPSEVIKLIGKKYDYVDTFYTLSNYQCIDVWTLGSDYPIRSLQFNHKVLKAVVSPKDKSCLYVLICLQKNSKSNGKFKSLDYQVYRVDLEDHSHTQCINVPNSGSRISAFEISRSGEVIVCAYGREFCKFMTADPLNTLSKIQVDDEVTCLCIHPDDSVIAVGDKAGRITLLHTNLKSTINNGYMQGILKTTLHWHSRSVNCVEYSLDGLILISGGSEMVLVFWYLEQNLKRFLPRLQSPIKSITSMPNGSSIVALFNDNSAGFFNMGTMSRESLISGPNEIAINSSDHKNAFSRILDNSYMIFQKRNGMIQFFNYTTDRPVFEVDVTCETLVSHPNSTDVPGSKVECLIISRDGKWMVTTDRHNADTDEKDMSATIKLWNRCQSEYGFTLSTRIYSAHKGMIVSVDISPNKNRTFATASVDQTFKVWTLKDKKWTSSAAQNFRNETPLSVTFSGDGAVLAVVYSKVISLWDPSTLSLLATLSFQESPKSYRGVKFIMDSYLLAYNSKKLCVWDLSSFTVLWCIYCAVMGVSTLENSNIIAVAVNAKQNSVNILLFDVLNPIPVHKIPTRNGYVYSKLLYQSSGVAVSILYSDCSIDIHSTSQDMNPPKSIISDHITLNANVLTNKFNLENSNNAITVPSVVGTNRVTNWMSKNPEYTSTPSHMLGSVTSLCSEYLKFQLARSHI